MKRSRLRARPKASTFDAALAAHWKNVVAPRTARCAACGSPRRVQGHHPVSQQALKAYARSLRLTVEETQALLWDVRNGLAVCSACHDMHHSAQSRLHRSLLLPLVWMFADELDARVGNAAIRMRLEREYAP